jgi:NAD(P)-dependent dehydrogenase (short-subunit alcohol dehydrogenase family)
MGLEGKVAVVTGAGQSLGRAIARVLAGRGAAVMITGRTLAKLEAVRDEIRSAGGTVELDQGDVGSRPDVERMVARPVAAFGGIDILVNNAQAWERGRPLAEVTDDILTIPLRSGLYGSLYTMQVAGMPGWAPYGIAKEAIRGLTRVAAKEWGPDNTGAAGPTGKLVAFSN